MRIEARIFELVTIFFFVFAVIYGAWSEGEPVGTTALVLSGALALIVGTYFRFVARRVPMRPEDDPDAEISDGAGELGFFSPGSYWPFTLALAAALTAYAVAFFEVWLIAIGIAAVLLSVAGLVFEYHTKPNES